MSAALTNKFTDTFNTTNPNSARVATSRTSGAASLTCDNLAGWPTVSKVHFATYTIDTNNAKVAGSQIDWTGIVSGNTIGSMTRMAGATDNGNTIGQVVEMMPTASWAHDVYSGLTAEHNQDGSHSAITATSIVTSGNITAANFIQTGGAAANGWTTGLPAPNTVTYNGNHSYSMVFNASDQTGTLSPGMRLRTTRTVAAPTQCTSLNGTTQYYSKTSPAGMTFTTAITTMGWVKPAAYQESVIVSKTATAGTDGFRFYIDSNGTIVLNCGARYYVSAQSAPLNKWVHIAATMDLAAGTGAIYLDGVLIPGTLSGSGASFTQAGNLNVGARTGSAGFFNGKIAQAAVFSAVLSQSTIQSYISQGLTGTETSLVSAYSFNNSINDLNTTNANNLTANGSAVATNADSPFSQQAGGVPNGTLDYGIIQSVSFSTNTTVVVQVPEGCTIGGVSAVVYSTQKAPYGFPGQRGKWTVETLSRTQITVSAASTSVWYNSNIQLTLPLGEWDLGYQGIHSVTSAGSGYVSANISLSTSASSVTDTRFPSQTPVLNLSSTQNGGPVKVSNPVSQTAQGIWYSIANPVQASETVIWAGNIGDYTLRAENAYL